jgi:hypothetical protein
MLVFGFIGVSCAAFMAFMLGGWKHVNMRPSDLWRWDGELDRESYLLWGLSLFALKHNLDRLLAWQVPGRCCTANGRCSTTSRPRRPATTRTGST